MRKKYDVHERKWQLTGREVEEKMTRMVEGIIQHNKDFVEMNKISSVDQIRLRNSKLAEAPDYPKPYKRRNMQRASFGSKDLSGSEMKLIQNTIH